MSSSTLARFLPALILALLGAIACALLLPGERLAIQNQIAGFPDSDPASHLARLPVLTALCLLPAAAAFVYGLGGTLDRYIARQFLGIFLICLSALVLIWLLIDVQDNLGDFLDAAHPAATIATFYAARSSAILLFLLPYALLLSLLYSLGKFSSTREIIAMLQSGRGILRITTPLVAAGIFCTLLCMGLNYHWAPVAEGSKDNILNQALGKSIREAANVLYITPAGDRLWMVGEFPPDYEKGRPLLNVEVTTTHPDGTLESRITAREALWTAADRHWTFTGATVCEFPPGEPPVFETPADPVVRTGWQETPWQLIKPGLPAAFLGIPDLNSWLATNAGNRISGNPAPYLTHWHHRWALPCACLVTVLLATPLSIHFSRRGPGASIFVAIVLSAMMLLFSSISLVLGEASILPPALAAWLPNLAFGLLALYLFQRRITGRPIYQRLRALFGND